MSSPRPPWAVGMHEARKPSPASTRHESIGLAAAASYSAARGAMCSRVSRATRSRMAVWPVPIIDRSAHAADGLAVAGDAAAGARLMQLDHVAERVVQEDLLRLGADHAAGHPVLHAHPLQLRLRLLDVGHRERHVRTRGIF